MKCKLLHEEDIMATARQHGVERMEQAKYAVSNERGQFPLSKAKRREVAA